MANNGHCRVVVALTFKFGTEKETVIILDNSKWKHQIISRTFFSFGCPQSDWCCHPTFFWTFIFISFYRFSFSPYEEKLRMKSQQKVADKKRYFSLHRRNWKDDCWPFCLNEWVNCTHVSFFRLEYFIHSYQSLDPNSGYSNSIKNYWPLWMFSLLSGISRLAPSQSHSRKACVNVGNFLAFQFKSLIA